MRTKNLVERKRSKYFSKSIGIVENPRDLLPALNPLAWRILNFLSENPSYPNEVAKKLKVHEQKVYYHIRRLEKAGLIEVLTTRVKRGAICKYYVPTSSAFGVEISKKEEQVRKNSMDRVLDFFNEFLRNGVFNGTIVVGSPVQHGPYLTSARDGHSAIQLALFLGNLCEVPDRFVVKLDTEVGEKKDENFILIGGPVTNMITSQINEKLKIKFLWREGWKVFSELSKKEYAEEEVGIVAKIKNPWDDSKVIVVLAGLTFESTKACIFGIVKYYNKILKDYKRGEEFFRLIRGLDKNGDGEVDYIKILE